MPGAGLTEPLPPDAICRACGYPLRGLAVPRCPECGQAFEPADPATMAFARYGGALMQFCLAPPGWILNGTALAVALLFLYGNSVPGDYWLPMFFSVFAGLGVLGVWAVRLALRAVVRWRHPLVRTRVNRSWHRLLFAPLVAAAAVALAEVHAPRWLAFALSRPAMDDLARQVLAAPPGTAFPAQWVGVYKAANIQRTAYGMSFAVDGADFLNATGFAYAPASQPAEPGASFRPWAPPWWIVTFDF